MRFALPVADEARRMCVQRSTDEEGIRADEDVGYRKRQWWQKSLIFDG